MLQSAIPHLRHASLKYMNLNFISHSYRGLHVPCISFASCHRAQHAGAVDRSYITLTFPQFALLYPKLLSRVSLILSMKGIVFRYVSGPACNAKMHSLMSALCQYQRYHLQVHRHRSCHAELTLEPCTQMARSLVMCPFSTVLITAASRSWQNLASSSLSSSFAL